MLSIWYLWPEWQTYGWTTVKLLVQTLWIEANLVWEKDQSQLLNDILRWTSEHVACVVAYSNNLWPYGVSKIWDDIVRFSRTEWRLEPQQCIALARVKIEQCLIGKTGTCIEDITTVYAHPQAANQTTIWRNKHLKSVSLIDASSNWAAINQILESNGDGIAAIWPAFWIKSWLDVLKKGIDNTAWSMTSFAFIQNKRKEFPFEIKENSQYGSILFIKLGKNTLESLQKITALFVTYGIESSLMRMMNSPHSGNVVLAVEFASEEKWILEKLIQDLHSHDFDISIHIQTKGVKKELQWINWSIQELQYLWPCPLIEINP